jgi:hypothetical protein
MYARAARWLLLLALLSCAPARTESLRAPAPAQPPAAATTPTPGPPTPAAEEAPNVVSNPRYKLSCLFLEDADGTEYVVLRDDATGRRARYFPTRQPGRAPDTAESYYREVWSPDGEYLALPLNPFDGFCVIRAKGALRAVARRRCDDFIRVLDYRPRMEVREVAFHHEWSGWETGSAFSFRAGLSGEDRTFVYDAGRGRLYDGGARREEYLAYLRERVAKNDARQIGENRRGRVEVVEGFRRP